MSAIVGIFSLDGRPAKCEDLEQMVAKLAHRGPDGSSIWFEGSTGLGNCMLHTTPESLDEHLPFALDGLVITADARIDNREELIANLNFKSSAEAKIADSELILEAYRKWGKDCPAKLLGDFVFAIWNKENQELFCARDHFGVRPLYFYHAPGKFFAFASEIKALHCLSDVPLQLNELRVGDYLAAFPEDKSITFYEGILRLPPANSLSITSKNIHFSEYWRPEPDYELRFGSDREYAEAYFDVFSKAVQCRLRSAFPIGSALSGGLDSSSIVCLAREYLIKTGRPSLKTFSGIFNHVPESDESPYIHSLIKQGNIEPHFIHADQISPLIELQRVLWHQEEPIWTPNLFMHWGLYNSAQQQGVRVFLDGFLGDNVVCHGWEHLMDLAYAWRLPSLYKQIGGIVKHQTGYARPLMLWRYFWEFSLKPHLLKKAFRTLQHKTPTIGGLGYKIKPSFARQINLRQRLLDFQSPDPTPPGAAKYRHYRDLTAGEIPLGLEISDKISKAFSLEVRYPFTDRRLAELCLAMPASQRIKDGRSRIFVRHALSNHLPSKICWRSGKGDLSINIKRGLLKFERLFMDKVILKNPKIIEDYIDIKSVQENYKCYKKHSTDIDIHAIWLTINLAAWLNQEYNKGVNSPHIRNIQYIA